MKLKSIVALLGLSVSLGTLAAPLVQNSPTPSVINPAPGGEGNLMTTHACAYHFFRPISFITSISRSRSASSFLSFEFSASS